MKIVFLGTDYYFCTYKTMCGYGHSHFEAINQLLGRIYA